MKRYPTSKRMLAHLWLAGVGIPFPEDRVQKARYWNRLPRDYHPQQYGYRTPY